MMSLKGELAARSQTLGSEQQLLWRGTGGCDCLLITVCGVGGTHQDRLPESQGSGLAIKPSYAAVGHDYFTTSLGRF